MAQSANLDDIMSEMSRRTLPRTSGLLAALMSPPSGNQALPSQVENVPEYSRQMFRARRNEIRIPVQTNNNILGEQMMATFTNTIPLGAHATQNARQNIVHRLVTHGESNIQSVSSLARRNSQSPRRIASSAPNLQTISESQRRALINEELRLRNRNSRNRNRNSVDRHREQYVPRPNHKYTVRKPLNTPFLSDEFNTSPLFNIEESVHVNQNLNPRIQHQPVTVETFFENYRNLYAPHITEITELKLEEVKEAELNNAEIFVQDIFQGFANGEIGVGDHINVNGFMFRMLEDGRINVMNQDHTKPLQEEEFKTMTEGEYGDISVKNNIDEIKCSICMTEFEQTEIIKLTKCKHIFHSECLNEWVDENHSCPVCREILGKYNIKDGERIIKEGNDSEYEEETYNETSDDDTPKLENNKLIDID
jgi:hypothetical protein